MTCLWHVRAELTEAAVEAARKSPVSCTTPIIFGWSVFFYNKTETHAANMCLIRIIESLSSTWNSPKRR